MEPRGIKHFKDAAAFRAWLEKNHARSQELWVGYYKKHTGRPSITWPESVDEALCFGWIDGLRKAVDEHSFTIRFTPRRPKSIWSAINTRRAKALIKSGAMQPAGLAAFKARTAKRSGVYSFEQRHTIELDPAHVKLFRRVPAAWEFFQAQPPGYRRRMAWWITSAMRETTRRSRLEKLIAHSALRQRVPQFSPTGKKEQR